MNSSATDNKQTIKKCSRCSANVSGDLSFCKNCSTKGLMPPERSQTRTSGKKKKSKRSSNSTNKSSPKHANEVGQRESTSRQDMVAADFNSVDDGPVPVSPSTRKLWKVIESLKNDEDIHCHIPRVDDCQADLSVSCEFDENQEENDRLLLDIETKLNDQSSAVRGKALILFSPFCCDYKFLGYIFSLMNVEIGSLREHVQLFI